MFRRVFSAIGTFVGMRGGDRYPVLVRKTEPKPIRVFLQDGQNDQWMGGPEVGDWWMFFWAHVPDWADDSGAGGMCMDRQGHPYVATRTGVQVFDGNGRSRGILPLPLGEATSVSFGGATF